MQASRWVSYCNCARACVAMQIWDYSEVLLCFFNSGYILMTLKLPAERLKAASILAGTIVDCENVNSDLIPYIAMESQSNRETILKCIISSHLK